ncbi:MAG: hypothetical protein U0R79_07480 [Propionicimonas sp.]
MKIIGHQRPEESGSQALLRKYVVGSAKMAKAPKDRITAEMGEIISGVADYANTGNADRVQRLLLPGQHVRGRRHQDVGGVPGVMPSSATIADGTYLHE